MANISNFWSNDLIERIKKTNPKHLIVALNPQPEKWYEVEEELRENDINALLLSKTHEFIIVNETHMNKLGWYRRE